MGSLKKANDRNARDIKELNHGLEYFLHIKQNHVFLDTRHQYFEKCTVSLIVGSSSRGSPANILARKVKKLIFQ